MTHPVLATMGCGPRYMERPALLQREANIIASTLLPWRGGFADRGGQTCCLELHDLLLGHAGLATRGSHTCSLELAALLPWRRGVAPSLDSSVLLHCTINVAAIVRHATVGSTMTMVGGGATPACADGGRRLSGEEDAQT
jgi:hypothetical protein